MKDLTTDKGVAQFDGAADDDLESENSESNDEEVGASIKLNRNDHAVSLLLTNARSLKPKMMALRDAFDSLKLNVACITETWYRGGSELRDHLIEVEGASGLRILHRSRDGRSKKSGGGVAIAFDTASCNLKMRTLKHIGKGDEVLCAVGVVGKVARKVAIFAIYVPPSITVLAWESLREAIAIEVGAVMKTYKDTIILITGYFNHRDIAGTINKVGQFKALSTGPTRGLNTIDIVYTNSPESHTKTLTLPPLCAEGGVPSDHRCVFTVADFPPTRGYSWEVKFRRTRDAAREDAFASDLQQWNWGHLESAGDVTKMAGALEEAIGTLTEKHFPLERTRRRSTEQPWITKKIRKLWRRKLRVYKKYGKNHRWYDTDRKLQEAIEDARSGFVDLLLEEGNSGKGFYSAVKKLSAPSAPSQWTVSDLFPGLSPPEMSSEVLTYYGNISNAPPKPIPSDRRP